MIVAGGKYGQIEILRPPKLGDETAFKALLSRVKDTQSLSPDAISSATITSVAEKAAIAEALRERVWPLIAAGRCKPVVDSTFPLAEAAAAHRRMESSAHFGKIVLTV